METTLDRFGRVVIPKDIRDALGLKPGELLKIEQTDDEVVLKPLREEPPIKVKNGVLVYAGTATGILMEAVRAHREERLRKVALPGRS
ncbi:MAG: AbrB/MazE/SpoVT family DNA-binding domain-containing protein [candidate division NC10 bacterium]|nr:AbrB/MazE/SpoVT family DNA-binding domain-containing protein [candidate division NC10 bacterium]